MALSAPECALLDDLPVPVAVVDGDGAVLWGSRALAEELGRSREGLAGAPFAALFCPVEAGGVERALSALAEGEAEVRFHTLRAGSEGLALAWRARARATVDGEILVVGEGGADAATLNGDLGQTEARLAEAQRMAALGNWEWDIRTGELWWSDEIYRIFGLSPREFGATYAAFLHAVHPDDRDFLQAAVDAALEGTPYAIDHRIVRPDGSQRLVHEQGAVSFNAEGEPVRMMGTVQDITARKEAEEALRLKEARHRQLLDGLGEGVFGVDPQGRFTFLNRAARQMLGLAREAEVLGEPSHTVAHHSDAAGHPYPESECPILQVAEGAEARPAWEDRFFRAGGESFPVEVHAAPLTGEDGEPDGAVVSFRDVTERHRLEVARNQLVAILEATPDYVAIADADGSLCYLNRGGRELLGLPLSATGEGDDIPPGTAGPPEEGRYAYPDWAARLVQEEGIPTALVEGRWQGESALLDVAGNEIPVSQVILAHHGEGGGLARLSTIMRDISEQKRLEAELEEEATHDPLTGVPNRLRFEQFLAHEINRSDRNGTPLSLIMFDLDRFKQVNDTYGHAVGDHVLTEVADRVDEVIRAQDLVARWGGEEFMVLLPETDREGACNLAEKLRAAVADDPFPELGRLTMSLGVTERRPEEQEDPLVSRVDEALYRAKDEGRNRVICV